MCARVPAAVYGDGVSSRADYACAKRQASHENHSFLSPGLHNAAANLHDRFRLPTISVQTPIVAAYSDPAYWILSDSPCPRCSLFDWGLCMMFNLGLVPSGAGKPEIGARVGRLPKMQKRYRLFFGYSLEDKAWSKRLHTWLDNYAMRRDLLVDVEMSWRLAGFSRTDEGVTARADVDRLVRAAIETAECLIIICSPRSAKSKWVNSEILHFRRSGRSRKIFALIVDGVPGSGDPTTECLPPALRAVRASQDPEGMHIELQCLNVRKEGRGRLCARLAAGFLDVDFDEVW